MTNDNDNADYHHLRGSQSGLDHTGWVPDKGEHRPVCRLSGNCSHDADADADEGEGEGKCMVKMMIYVLLRYLARVHINHQ